LTFAGECVACTETDGRYLFAFIVASWAYAFVFHSMSQGTSGGADLLINVLLFSVLCVCCRLSRWFPAVRAICVHLPQFRCRQFNLLYCIHIIFSLRVSAASNCRCFLFNLGLAIFNFNVFSAGSNPTCIAPLTDMQRLATGLFVPLFGFGFLAINCLLHSSVWVCRRGFDGSRNRSDSSALCFVLAHHQSIPALIRTYRRTALAYLCSSCM
jgi:hypothetical protein